ncbi:MAG: hypothetical protein ACN4ES_03535 [Cellulophaga baltica]
MKKFLILLFLIVLVSSCGIQQKERVQEPSKISYTAQSRGFRKNVLITKTTITVTNEGENTYEKINYDAARWIELCHLITVIDLNKLKEYKGTTEASAVDRALIAHLEIETNAIMYRSNGFDHDNPPKELKAIIDKILAMSETGV